MQRSNTLRFSYSVIIILYALLHFVHAFYPAPYVSVGLSVLGMLAFLFSIFFLQLQKASIALFLFMLAIIIHLVSGHSIMEGAMSGFTVMSGLIALLLIVPTISWVLKEKPYIESVIQYAQKMLNTSRKFYFGMMFITQVISFFLLFGAIPMVYQMVNDFLKNEQGEAWENYKGTALLRGFALTTMWVVSIPSFVFAVEHLDASLSLSILQGAIISLAGIALSLCFSYFQEKKYRINLTKGIQYELSAINEHGTGNGNRFVTEFAILFITLFGTIFLLNSVLPLDLLLLIPLVIAGWIALYFVLHNRTAALVKHGRTYVKDDITNQSQQFSILLSAGFLIHAVQSSGFGSYLVDGMFFLSDAVPFLNFLFVLPFVVIVLGFIGLGPLTVIVLVSGILQGVSLPYPPEIVVLGITSGSVISIMLSPLILPVIILSSTNQLGTFKNGFKFNIAYSIAFYLLVQIYLQSYVHFIL
ncbi:hypothetical protein ACFFGV_06335 [Pontibacillus salicampi]|uniref:Permease n=1 Tax=Pontibacillus salicampi TaxID=1449801 RepID=A0ABV6LLD2_9BACI